MRAGAAPAGWWTVSGETTAVNAPASSSNLTSAGRSASGSASSAASVASQRVCPAVHASMKASPAGRSNRCNTTSCGRVSSAPSGSHSISGPSAVSVRLRDQIVYAGLRLHAVHRAAGCGCSRTSSSLDGSIAARHAASSGWASAAMCDSIHSRSRVATAGSQSRSDAGANAARKAGKVAP